MRLVFFEDENYSDLYPLTYLRAAFDLRCGMHTAAARLAGLLGAGDVSCFVRPALEAVYRERTPDRKINDPSVLKGEIVVANGRLLDPWAAGELKSRPGRAWMKGDRLIAARLTAEQTAACDRSSIESFVASAAKSLERVDCKWRTADFPWDLVNHNAALITEDFEAAGRRGVEGTIHPLSCVFGPAEKCYIAPGAEVEPMVCIDTRHGPVYIDERATVNPQTRLEGPCYIGKETMIVGAKIREGCSIGPVCRVGGEVEESIIHGCSNKYHDGFLGHAYVCEWVNLGALTTNSDIKNDYGPVKVYVNGAYADTGTTKVGCFIGDHTKTSIGVVLNTGSHIGVMTLLMTGGSVLPKFVPSFAWCVEGAVTRGFGLDALLDTARVAMGRRKKKLTPAEEALLREVHKLTESERMELVRKDRRKLLA
jgi:UDP-N-acetylglucosamine diphosphorylase/glucosamine-1-phosphate N-acetyltransferase